MRTFPVFRLCCALLLVGVSVYAQEKAPGNDTIRRDQLEADLTFLAGDGMRGRLTGSAEYNLAAEWIESRFRHMGLLPGAGGGSYQHRYDLVRTRLAEPNSLRITHQGRAGGATTGRLRENFHPLIFSASAEAEQSVVFVGYGIRASKLQWIDYAPADVNGKVVLMLDGEPGADDPSSPFDGVVTSEYANTLRKTLEAQQHGASAVLFVSRGSAGGRDTFPASSRAIWPDTPPHLERYTLAAYANRIRIPVAQISPALAAQILNGEAAASDKTPHKPVVTAAVAALRVSLRKEIVEDRSIVARIEGSDPALKDEAVLISAHYDHNGATAEQIFAGADDNGSGTVALLEIAEAYALAAAQGKRPKRTVLFAAWGSEERCCGPLLGAWAWVEHPAWPMAKTVALLNMDMIGRSEEVPINGGGRFRGLAVQSAASNANNVNILGWSFSPDLARVVEQANAPYDLGLLKRYDNNASNLLRRSDQWPFLQRGVPSLWFHTGLHPDYHTQYDRPERIDYPKMERIARLVHNSSWRLANQAGRPRMLEQRPIPTLAPDR
jgi:hypothetical protein